MNFDFAAAEHIQHDHRPPAIAGAFGLQQQPAPQFCFARDREGRRGDESSNLLRRSFQVCASGFDRLDLVPQKRNEELVAVAHFTNRRQAITRAGLLRDHDRTDIELRLRIHRRAAKRFAQQLQDGLQGFVRPELPLLVQGGLRQHELVRWIEQRGRCGLWFRHCGRLYGSNFRHRCSGRQLLGFWRPRVDRFRDLRRFWRRHQRDLRRLLLSRDFRSSHLVVRHQDRDADRHVVQGLLQRQTHLRRDR